jgi:LPS-assembly lipoprotein
MRAFGSGSGCGAAEDRPGRSRAGPWRAAPALLLAATLGACGFKPVYGPGALTPPEMAEPVEPVRAELAAIRVPELGGRLGQILRNELIDRLNPAGVDVPPAYVLGVSLRRDTRALAVQIDDTATRADLMVAAAFELRRVADDRTLYTSEVRRVASYDIRVQPFAVLAAERDAERRAARAVGEDIAIQLAVLFARGLPEVQAATEEAR